MSYTSTHYERVNISDTSHYERLNISEASHYERVNISGASHYERLNISGAEHYERVNIVKWPLEEQAKYRGEFRAPANVKRIVAHAGRMYGWGDPDNPERLYFSEFDEPEYFPLYEFGIESPDAARPYAGGWAQIGAGPWDPVIACVPEPGGFNPTGGKGHCLLVFMTDRCIRWYGADWTDFMRGPAMTGGCIASESAADTGDRIIWLSHDGLRSLRREARETEMLSLAVQAYLPQGWNTALIEYAAAAWQGGRYYLSFGPTSAATNSSTLILLVNDGAWERDDGVNANQFNAGGSSGLLYADSRSTGRVMVLGASELWGPRDLVLWGLNLTGQAYGPGISYPPEAPWSVNVSPGAARVNGQLVRSTSTIVADLTPAAGNDMADLLYGSYFGSPTVDVRPHTFPSLDLEHTVLIGTVELTNAGGSWDTLLELNRRARGQPIRWATRLLDMNQPYRPKHIRRIVACFTEPVSAQDVVLDVYTNGESTLPVYSAARTFTASGSGKRCYVDVYPDVWGRCAQVKISGNFTSGAALEWVSIEYSYGGEQQGRGVG